MRYRRGYSRSRYRGSRRRPPWPALLLLAAAAAAAVYFLLLPRLFPADRGGGADGSRSSGSSGGAVSAMAQTSLDISQDVREPEPPAALPEPPAAVRGIYITGPTAGSGRMAELTALMDGTELNAAVIDLKNDEGALTYLPQSGRAAELGTGVKYIADLPGLVSSLKDRGIYTIARIASFKDPALAKARPELALHMKDGSRLSQGEGKDWVNPYDQEVWDYLTEIALEAARAGFDEVQLDYVRFPTVRDIEAVDFGPAAGQTGREEIVCQFLAHMREALHREGVRLSADVFGTVIDSALDAGLIGQNYPAMAREADFICPMVYPSHYAAGSYGQDVPDRAPYETVKAALDRSRAALEAVEEGERAVVRPWLQDFTASWVKDHIPYGAQELRAQIQAAYDAGCTGWLLWNAGNVYSADGLLPA